MSDTPAWPTTLRSRLRDGRLMGTDGSVWMYKAVPMSPIADARDTNEHLQAAQPIYAAVQELAMLTPVQLQYRRFAKGNYREIHILLVNIPRLYRPTFGHPLEGFLREQFTDTVTNKRILLFGVKLKDKIGGNGSLRSTIDSVVETLVSGNTPLSDYDEDTERVGAALLRAGLTDVDPADIALANAWWNRGENPDTPTLIHSDHVHIFDSAESVNLAKAAGVESCAQWDPDGETPVPGQHSITFASVQSFDLPFIDPASHAALWATNLIDCGAIAVSMRGSIEPGSVTRQELRRQRKRYIDDINERARQGKMQRAEQDEMLGMLEGVEGMYATGGGSTPTLAGTSIVAAISGSVRDITQVMPGSVANLALMTYRQMGAMAETMLCSNVRANPNLHDLPAQVPASAGLPSLSFVGDDAGALVGFTERDRQAAFLSPTAASAGDALPLMLIAGATGAGKTQVLLFQAFQFAKMGVPSIIVDPKTGSDHGPIVQAAGGQVASLDQLASADGIFDPIRFAASAEVGVELASSMLMSINPWGSRRDDMEVPLQHALSYGVGQGAKCIGQALNIAEAAEQQGILTLPDGLIGRIRDLNSSSPMFRAIAGVNPSTDGLRASNGITLIKVGDSFLDLPEPGAANPTLNQRVALALVRMMVFGSAMALTNRGGAVMLDEAWVFLGAGRSEVERLGRLARSQQVLPMLFTQRVTDAVDAGLSGYISRGLILPIEDPSEAAKACELFNLEPTQARLARITAKATMGGSSNQAVQPNWRSMRALRDPVTGRVIRGAVAIYADLAGRAIPVEITLPQEFLRLASTNPEDIRRRNEEAARLRAMAEQAALLDSAPDTGGGAVLDEVF